MNKMPSIFRSFLLFFVLFSGQSVYSPSLAQSVDVLDRLKSTYEGIDILRASFDQQITSPFGDTSPHYEGTIILSGDRYRIETEFQTFVTDGQVTWIYNSVENQVLINDYVEDETTFSISDFFTNFYDAYALESREQREVAGKRHHVLVLAPLADDTFFRKVTLWVRDEDTMVTRLHVVDVNQAILDFELDAIEINPTLDYSPFEFTPPDTAEIIDLRS